MKSWWPAMLALSLGACTLLPGKPGGGEPLVLAPPDTRPVLAIEVADDIEVALLQQQLGLAPLWRDGGRLYFQETEGISDRLRQYGYVPERANAYEVYRRVVRVYRKGDEDALARFGVDLVNREDTYWIVEGSLGNLRALERAGYRLDGLGTNEPRPREIRIHLRSRDDVQRISNLHVDIYGVSESGGGLLLTGAAFDQQIDQLQAAGFTVERVAPPDKGEKP